MCGGMSDQSPCIIAGPWEGCMLHTASLSIPLWILALLWEGHSVSESAGIQDHRLHQHPQHSVFAFPESHGQPCHSLQGWSWLRIRNTWVSSMEKTLQVFLSTLSTNFHMIRKWYSIFHTTMLLIDPLTNREGPLSKACSSGLCPGQLFQVKWKVCTCYHWYGCWMHVYTIASQYRGPEAQ